MLALADELAIKLDVLPLPAVGIVQPSKITQPSFVELYNRLVMTILQASLIRETLVVRNI